MRPPEVEGLGRNEQRLRVALVGDYPLNTAQFRGGVQSAFMYLVRGLARIDGLEVHVLTFKRHDWTGPDCLGQDGVTVHLLPLHPRFERLRNYRKYQTSLNREIEQIQPDIVHAQEAAADAYVALRSGYPTVVTAHGIRSEDTKYSNSWGQRLRFYFDSVITERSVIRQTRHLIAISRYVTEYFAPLLRPDINIYEIPNAVDEQFFNLTSDTPRQVILFAGRVTPLKRVMDLVQAFAQVVREVPSAQLRIAGECNSDSVYAESIRQWIRQADLEERIHLLGELGQEAVSHEFARCELLVLPSAQENAPVVIAQAMAAGKPVVATRVGGVGEMVGEAGERGLLVNVGDVDGLARAIMCLLQDPALQVRLGEAGRVYARENYKQDRVARRTFEIYMHIRDREYGFNA